MLHLQQVLQVAGAMHAVLRKLQVHSNAAAWAWQQQLQHFRVVCGIKGSKLKGRYEAVLKGVSCSGFGSFGHPFT